MTIKLICETLAEYEYRHQQEGAKKTDTADRYIIVSHDWQRFDRRYSVIDTKRHGTWVLQTNDFARAVSFRDELNAEFSCRGM